MQVLKQLLTFPDFSFIVNEIGWALMQVQYRVLGPDWATGKVSKHYVLVP